MNELAEPSFVLRHIHRCGADGQNQPSQQANTSAVVTTVTHGSSYTTEVLLKVGVRASPSLAYSSSCAPSQETVCYMCPAYILQAGCPTLRELLADAFEGGPSGIRGVDDEAGANAAAAVARVSSSPPVAIPLPFLDGEVFEVVAVYLEHFYAFDFTITTGITPTAARPSVTSLATSSARTPSSLRRPLSFQDLYALSTWEHHYVLSQLLGVERSQIDSLRLVECGVWVDLLGGAAAVPPPKGETRQQHQVNVAEGTVLSQQRADCFSLANRRRMWSRLCQILEAALRLGMTTLRLLCATVAADMLVDLDEAGLARLMQLSGDGSGIKSIPPLTAQARAQLLHRFPWLKLQ
ncbi:hypothetical protein CUR178_05176 [Leishmania enriettii]|uniref:Uncharacterized protein n=1 Tax=Leishmania enriettii TaxID=5663 RepID=A0A836KLJ0_LEIEN|nr:hypothetical protein CUR178_05176 [Leishmania enriettii]